MHFHGLVPTEGHRTYGISLQFQLIAYTRAVLVSSRVLLAVGGLHRAQLSPFPRARAHQIKGQRK